MWSKPQEPSQLLHKQNACPETPLTEAAAAVDTFPHVKLQARQRDIQPARFKLLTYGKISSFEKTQE